jgi:hypothetical protein
MLVYSRLCNTYSEKETSSDYSTVTTSVRSSAASVIFPERNMFIGLNLQFQLTYGSAYKDARQT